MSKENTIRNQEIRKMRNKMIAKKTPYRTIAKQFGITVQAVHQIINRKNIKKKI